MGGFIFKNKKGFTLIEAILIVAVVSVFLSALLPFIVENLTANARSKKRLLAYESAYGKMEDLRHQAYDSLTDGGFTVSNVEGATGQVTISQVDLNDDGTMDNNILGAKVEVVYEEKGQSKSMSLNTLITRNGVIDNE